MEKADFLLHMVKDWSNSKLKKRGEKMSKVYMNFFFLFLKEIKNKLEGEIGVKASHQRIFFKCVELRNNMGLEYYAIGC